MKLKQKILLGFAMLIALLLTIEGYTLLFLNRSNQRINTIAGQQFKTAQLVQKANNIVMQIHSDIWDAMLLGKEMREMRSAELKENGRMFYTTIRQLEDELPDRREELTALSRLFRVYFQFGTSILDFKDLTEFKRRDDVVMKFKENKLGLIEMLDETVADSSHNFEQALESLKHDFERMTALIAVLTIVMVVLAVMMSVLMANALTRPVNELMTAMKEFQTGKLSVRAEVHTRDELGTLAESFNVMGRELEESLKRKEEQERLEQEMALARQIQTAILPGKVEHDELDIEAVMLPADEVGGDYYDMVYSDDDRLWLGIGDVSGHGVTPGLIMMMAQTIHTTLVSQHYESPKDVVNEVNRMLFHNVNTRLKADHFMTFTTLKYLGNGDFVHAGAHLSLVLYRRQTGECELIDTSGTWLNFVPDISHATQDAHFHMELNDVLVLYTDGLTEAQNDRKELLDISRFIELVRSHAEKPPKAMRDAILEDVLQWCGNHREDDMSLVVVRRVK